MTLRNALIIVYNLAAGNNEDVTEAEKETALDMVRDHLINVEWGKDNDGQIIVFTDLKK